MNHVLFLLTDEKFRLQNNINSLNQFGELDNFQKNVKLAQEQKMKEIEKAINILK